MASIIKAGAWCNGEVAYIAWAVDDEIPDCLGFMITRVHETGDEAGLRRILPTWIAFTDQSNPDWLDQDSSVWPIQQFQWRDLTLRRSRAGVNVRPIDFRVHYEITPLGLPGPGRETVPASVSAPYRDANGAPRYDGPPRQLAMLDEPFRTPTIDVTHDHPRGGPIKATYTNGILSTQNLLQQLEALSDAKPRGVKPGPASRITPGLLSALKDHIPRPGDGIRTFLTADVLPLLLSMFDRAETEGGELYLALYELHDPELIGRLIRLAAAGKAHIILSTAGSTDPNQKRNPPQPRTPMVWDTENHDARAQLHAASPANVQDRLFNNASHIGHNKFVVYVKDDAPMAVLTGSTNWTETGLCTQSNNVIVLEDQRVAKIYLDYWHRLKADPQPAGQSVAVPFAGEVVQGFAKNSGVQAEALRASNVMPVPPVKLADGSTVEVLFSPNTRAVVKNAKSPTPPDLSRVYALMEQAKDAILFLSFLPGMRGNQNIIGQAAMLAKDRPDLLVQGAISDPGALPPRSSAEEPETYIRQPGGAVEKLPRPAIWWPEGRDSRIVMIRASAVRNPTGDLRPELLTAGHAIIHDKIIVIDPLDPVNCTVITGSHNMGYKASYQNDENLLIIRGNPSLACSYAVHVLDVYDHYLMRAKLEDARRKALIKTGREPESGPGGFLSTKPDWQARLLAASSMPTSRAYFLR